MFKQVKMDKSVRVYFLVTLCVGACFLVLTSLHTNTSCKYPKSEFSNEPDPYWASVGHTGDTNQEHDDRSLNRTKRLDQDARSLNRTERLNRRGSEPFLLTIFTSFIDTPSKYFVHRNVILNWAQLSTRIQPILFANLSVNSSISRLAEQHGWIIHPLPKDTRPPDFKGMYRMAYNLSNSIFYGFCNGDILFNNGLVATLETVIKYSELFKSTMVVGRRSNLNINESSDEPLYKHDILNQRAKKASLFSTWAEDYFFISKPHIFPWHIIRNVVISRPGYDNYMVAQAVRGNASVIDATNTVLAVHQTGKDGNSAGHHKKTYRRYNIDLIGSFNFGKGTTDHAQYVTTKDVWGSIFLQKRQKK